MNSEVRIIAPPNKLYITIGGSLVVIVVLSMLLFPDIWRVGVYALVGIGMATAAARGVVYLSVAYHKWVMMSVERERARNECNYLQVAHTNYLYDVRHNCPVLAPVALRTLPAGEMVIDAPQLAAPRRSALDLLADGYHFMLVGDTGSGKTTLAANIVQRVGVANAIVCDSDAIFNRWPAGIKVVSDYDDIAKVIYSAKTLMQKRYDTGTNAPVVTLVIDEVPTLIEELRERGIDGGLPIRQLVRRGRKAGICLVIMAQGDNVDDLGQRGHGSVKKSFVKITMSLENRRNGFAVVKHANGDAEEVTLPAPIVNIGGQVVTLKTEARKLPRREADILAMFDGGTTSLRAIALAVGIGDGGNQKNYVKLILEKHGRM